MFNYGDPMLFPTVSVRHWLMQVKQYLFIFMFVALMYHPRSHFNIYL